LDGWEFFFKLLSQIQILHKTLQYYSATILVMLSYLSRN
jgi:hypothetical protein